MIVLWEWVEHGVIQLHIHINIMKNDWPKKGDKLRFKGVPKFVYPHFTNIIEKAQNKLTVGQEYTVEKSEVYSSWCAVWLEGNEGEDDLYHLQFFEQL